MKTENIRQRGTSEVDELLEIAQEAYIWGSPLVQFGEYQRLRALDYQPLNRAVVWMSVLEGDFAPSQEVMYGCIDFELSKEPQILSVPEIKDRYYSIQFTDPFFNAFAYIGTRATGTEGGLFGIVGPDWKGTLPKGVTRIDCPSNRLLAYIRTGVNSKADVGNAIEIAKQYKISPLSKYPEGFKGTKAGEKSPSVSFFPNYQGDREGIRFFDKLGVELESTPFGADEAELAKRFLRIGVGPGLRPSESGDTQLLDILAKAIPLAQKRIDTCDLAKVVNNWSGILGVTSKIKDPLLRAFLQRLGGGHNIADEGLIFKCFVGPDNKPLSGANRYRLYFPAGELPPVEAFWSVCLLDPKGIPVKNPIHRHAVSSLMTEIEYGPGGSLDIVIQHEQPAAEKNKNWLPSPAGEFYFFMRLYLPKPIAVAGKYAPPMLEMLE